MTVYVAQGSDCDGSSVYGVYSTPEQAVEAIYLAVEEEKTNKYTPYTAFNKYTYFAVELNEKARPQWEDHEGVEEVLVLDMKEYNNQKMNEDLAEMSKEYGWETLDI